MVHLSLRCFGTFQASLDSRPLASFHSVKVQALLAYLALEADRPHSRETLATLLWPLDGESSARNSLRQALYELRKTLGDRDDLAAPFLLVTRQSVQFNPAGDYTLDAADFLAHVKNNEWEQAARLYRGELLAGLSCESELFEEWLRLTRARFHNQAVDGCFKLTDHALKHEDFVQARSYAERQLALEPWREEAHRQLMLALAIGGERSAALTQYEICRRILAEELGVEPDTETTALYEQIRLGKLRGQTATLHPLPTSPRLGEEPSARLAPLQMVRHNLPPQATPFVGRSAELAQIATRLQDADCRLLTLVGAGGMGKTRLALQAAQRIVDLGLKLEDSSAPTVANPQSTIRNPQFSDGVFFVALVGVGSPDLLVSTIAGAIGFPFYGGGDPKLLLMEYLRPKSMLLLLDNFEHLLAGTDLVADLLAAAPGVKVLATSREPLNLYEEWLFPVGGMRWPDDGSREALEALAAYSAVQLYVRCAQRTQPGFDLAAEGDAVVRICRLVEGMPLGIELAAAWRKFYSSEQIAQEVASNLDFLSTSLRNVPARHRSMKAVFEHSWCLLTPEEQQVFAQLSVFRGGFTQEAAQAVVAASRPLLLTLVEKSLLQLTPDRRFQLHELLRQFAEEKLQAVSEAAEQTQDRHCAYYASFLQRQESRLKGAQHVSAMTEIETEIENIRLAWQWAVAHGKVEEIDRAINSLGFFYDIKCWYKEAETVFQQAAAALRMDEPQGRQGVVYGKVLAAVGRIQLWWLTEREEQSSQDVTIALLQESLAILRRLGAHGETGEVLWSLGGIFCHTGNSAQSLHLLQEALAVFTEQHDRWGMSRALADMGFANAWMGKYQDAIHYYQQAIALCEERGDLRTVGDTLNVLGDAYKGLGEYEEARKAAQAALAANTATGDKRCIGWSLYLLGELAWRMGDYATAQQLSEESVALFAEIGLPREREAAVNNLGNIACCLGDYRQAHYYFGIVLKSQGTVNTTFMLPEALTGLSIVLAKEGLTAQAVELLQHVLQHPLARQVNKDWAMRLLAELPTEPAPGALRPLDLVMAELLNDKSWS